MFFGIVIPSSPWYNQFLDAAGKSESKKVVTITKTFSVFWECKYDALTIAKVTLPRDIIAHLLERTHLGRWLKQRLSNFSSEI